MHVGWSIFDYTKLKQTNNDTKSFCNTNIEQYSQNIFYDEPKSSIHLISSASRTLDIFIRQNMIEITLTIWNKTNTEFVLVNKIEAKTADFEFKTNTIKSNLLDVELNFYSPTDLDEFKSLYNIIKAGKKFEVVEKTTEQSKKLIEKRANKTKEEPLVDKFIELDYKGCTLDNKNSKYEENKLNEQKEIVSEVKVDKSENESQLKINHSDSTFTDYKKAQIDNKCLYGEIGSDKCEGLVNGNTLFVKEIENNYISDSLHTPISGDVLKENNSFRIDKRKSAIGSTKLECLNNKAKTASNCKNSQLIRYIELNRDKKDFFRSLSKGVNLDQNTNFYYNHRSSNCKLNRINRKNEYDSDYVLLYHKNGNSTKNCSYNQPKHNVITPMGFNLVDNTEQCCNRSNPMVNNFCRDICYDQEPIKKASHYSQLNPDKQQNYFLEKLKHIKGNQGANYNSKISVNSKVYSSYGEIKRNGYPEIVRQFLKNFRVYRKKSFAVLETHNITDVHKFLFLIDKKLI